MGLPKRYPSATDYGSLNLLMKFLTTRPLALILLAAFALRLLAGWLWQSRLPGPFGFGDSLSYWQLAQDLAFHRPYTCGGEMGWIFRTPGYPMLLAPIFWIAGPDASPLWGRALGAVLGTLAVLGVWWLACRLFNPKAGLVAAAVAAVYPGAIATSVFILSEAPFCPLVLANLILWIVAWQAPSPVRLSLWALAAGIAAAATTLVRPSWLLFLPFAVVALLVLSGQRKRTLATGAVICLGFAVTMTPWWIRNARLTGHFVPTSLQVGASLYDGLNPQATGASNMDFVGQFARPLVDNPPPGARKYPAGLEYELDRRLRDASLDWARQHPGRVLELAVIKFFRIWNLWPNEPAWNRWFIRVGTLVSYVPVLLLGLLGVVQTIRRGMPYIVCWLPAVYLTGLHVVFVSSIRYREPAMLGLIVLAAGVLAHRREATQTQT